MKSFPVILLLISIAFSGCSRHERLRGFPPGERAEITKEEPAETAERKVGELVYLVVHLTREFTAAMIAKAEREADELGTLLPPPKGVRIPMLASQDRGQ